MEGIGISSNLLVTTALLGFIPLLVVTSTSFLKLSVVLSLVRNALGVQQIPPNVVIYSLALGLSFYVMTPTFIEAARIYNTGFEEEKPVLEILPEALQPITSFMHKNSHESNLDYFSGKLDELWGESAENVPNSARDFAAVMPAFAFSQLTEAFEIGFLIYLPFIAIDLVISNILLALGMMMVSPVTISLPFKLFLFVAVDGWARLAQALIGSYT